MSSEKIHQEVLSIRFSRLRKQDQPAGPIVDRRMLYVIEKYCEELAHSIDKDIVVQIFQV